MPPAWSGSRGFSRMTRGGASRPSCRPVAASPTPCWRSSPPPSARRTATPSRLDAIRQRHVGIADTLLGAADGRASTSGAGRDCRDIAGILQTVRLMRIGSAVVRDLVAGLWRDLVDAAVRALPAGAGPARRRCALDRRAGDRADRRGAARAERPLAGVARQRRPRSSRAIRTRRSSSPASSRGRATACRPRSAATAATSPARSSARCSTRRRS